MTIFYERERKRERDKGREREIYLPNKVARCQKRLKPILLATSSIQYKQKYKYEQTKCMHVQTRLDSMVL